MMEMSQGNQIGGISYRYWLDDIEESCHDTIHTLNWVALGMEAEGKDYI